MKEEDFSDSNDEDNKLILQKRRELNFSIHKNREFVLGEYGRRKPLSIVQLHTGEIWMCCSGEISYVECIVLAIL